MKGIRTSSLINVEPNETSPLLGEPRRRETTHEHLLTQYNSRNSNSKSLDCNKSKAKVCKTAVFAILFILVVGFAIATYLLVRENRRPNLGFALDLVDRDIWSEVAMPLGNTLNRSNVLYIIILHTGGERCNDPDNCVRIIREFQAVGRQNRNDEIPYNFLIGGDGQTYEVRGWNHESGFALLPGQASLVIGFIGNYTNSEPSSGQLQSALSLINESTNRKKLHDQYRVYGLRNLTVCPFDGQALFNRISRWQRYDTLLHVL